MILNLMIATKQRDEWHQNCTEHNPTIKMGKIQLNHRLVCVCVFHLVFGQRITWLGTLLFNRQHAIKYLLIFFHLFCGTNNSLSFYPSDNSRLIFIVKHHRFARCCPTWTQTEFELTSNIRQNIYRLKKQRFQSYK